MASINQRLQDAAIRHQIFLQRQSTTIVRRMMAEINRNEREIIARIAELDPTSVAGRFQQGRLNRLLEDIREINLALQATLQERLGVALGDLAENEQGFQERLLLGTVATEVPEIAGRFDFVSPARVRAAALSRPFQGAHLRWATTAPHLREQMRRRGERVRGAIRQGFVQGETLGQIIARIRGTRANNFTDGELQITRNAAETMVRTAINHTANASRQFIYEQNEDIIKGVRYIAILDHRTSDICRALDGQIFPVDEGPRPPQHPNCRSTTAPILKSSEELGIDAEENPALAELLDGEVPEYTTYNDWLRTQPRSFVVEVLGPTRADLYLKGDLGLDRFVNRSGETLTLAELRRREAQAFRDAGLSEAA